MFYPVSLYIGLRYLYSNRRYGFTSIITVVSVLGITLSVMALVTAMSIMNGFSGAVRDKIFDTAQHITLYDMRKSVTQSEWPELRKRLLSLPAITNITPFLGTHGLVTYQKTSQPAVLCGILPELESTLNTKVIQGSPTLRPKANEIIMGEQMAQQLDVTIGSTVTLYLPLLQKGLFHVAPRTQTVQVIGIFKTGKGIGLDNSISYMHLEDLQQLLDATHKITGLRITTNNLYEAPELGNALATRLPPHYVVTDWTEQYGHLLKMIGLEKTMTLWILLLLVSMSAFNLLASLLMTVTEKKTEIAILQTIGLSSRTILNIFLIQGSLIGLIGTALGLSLGLLLSHQIGTLSQLLESWLQRDLFSGNIFIDRLPVEIVASDFFKVGIFTFLLSIVATLYPAWRATCTPPIKALRHE